MGLGELLDRSVNSDQWIAKEDAVEEVQRGDVTIFKSVGVGIQDVAISRAVVDCAKEYGIGSVIPEYH